MSLNQFLSRPIFQSLRGNVCGFTMEGVPVIDLFTVEEDGSETSVSRLLVEGGHAQWLEPAPVTEVAPVAAAVAAVAQE